MMALGCLFAFNAAAVRVPQDIALAGFDDSPLAGCTHPALTTMRIEIGELGRQAVRLLLAQGAGGGMPPSHTRIVPELVVRASTVRKAP